MENMFQDTIDLGITKPEQMKLTEISILAEFGDPDFKYSLAECYGAKSLHTTLLAVIFNSAATMERDAFLFSRPIFEGLLSKDSRVGRKTLSGDEYRKFMAWAYQNNFLSEVRRGDSKKGGRASLIGIIHPAFVNYIDKKIGRAKREALKEKFIALYDSPRLNSSPRSSPFQTSTEPEHESVQVLTPHQETSAEAEDFQDGSKIEAKRKLLKMSPKELQFAVIRGKNLAISTNYLVVP